MDIRARENAAKYYRLKLHEIAEYLMKESKDDWASDLRVIASAVEHYRGLERAIEKAIL